MRAIAVAALAAGLATATGCAASNSTAGPASPSPVRTPRTPHTVAPPGTGQGGALCRTVVVAAGDIVNDTAVADRTGAQALAQHPDLVLALGDNQYPSGALADYRAKYDRTRWGRLKSITKPVPGNHDYRTKDAWGYFTYFKRPPSHYAYDAGCGWRGYALDSERDLAAQAAWLRRDLAAHPDAPVLASWHRPRYSSGVEHGPDAAVQPFWDALAGRTGVVLNGHEHNYERFAPVGGVREFVVGTGGTSTYPFGAATAGSEQRIAHTPGVLRLELTTTGYRWFFLTTTGATHDSGAA